MALVKGTNSYVDLAEAESYFSDRIDADAWHDAVLSKKSQALIQATRTLEEMPWTSYAVSSSQNLAFPRVGEYFDPRLGYDISMSSGIPDRLVRATFELAIHYLENPSLLSNTGSISEVEIGPMTIVNPKDAVKIPNHVHILIRPLLQNMGIHAWWRAN